MSRPAKPGLRERSVRVVISGDQAVVDFVVDGNIHHRDRVVDGDGAFVDRGFARSGRAEHGRYIRFHAQVRPCHADDHYLAGFGNLQRVVVDG